MPPSLDARYHRLADLLLHYSLAVEAGQRLLLVGPARARPFLELLERHAWACRSCPMIRLLQPVQAAEETAALPLLQVQELVEADACLFVEAGPSPLIAAEGSEQRELLGVFLRRSADQDLRWTATIHPTRSDAQRAGLTLPEWREFLFRASFVDREDPLRAWKELFAHQQQLCKRLSNASEMHFTTPLGTDLRVCVRQRTWINSAGQWNMPDGEVFTAPLEDSAEGVLVLDAAAEYAGSTIEGLRLEFGQGRVTGVSADRGQKLVEQLLEVDDGASRLGEIALGCNYGITRRTHRTLLDEKIGGTFHIALGSAYPQSGGRNRSLLHWDLVCDLRAGGRVTADGQAISIDGLFLLPATGSEGTQAPGPRR